MGFGEKREDILISRWQSLVRESHRKTDEKTGKYCLGSLFMTKIGNANTQNTKKD
jgi:hypothetical protein